MWIDGAPAVLWIECKSETGRQTKEQKEFQQEVENESHKYIVVRDVDELKESLRIL